MKQLNAEYRRVRKKQDGKPHRCFMCLRDIPPGTEVFVQTCVDDGCVYTVMSCRPCLRYVDDYPELIDFWGNSYEQGCVEENISGDGEFGYWRRVKYFGYGGEKWD